MNLRFSRHQLIAATLFLLLLWAVLFWRMLSSRL